MAEERGTGGGCAKFAVWHRGGCAAGGFFGVSLSVWHTHWVRMRDKSHETVPGTAVA